MSECESGGEKGGAKLTARDEEGKGVVKVREPSGAAREFGRERENGNARNRERKGEEKT